MYIVMAGRARATKAGVVDAAGEPRVLMEYEAGQWFGELAITKDQRRSASVTAEGEVQALVLPRATLRELFGKLEAKMKLHAEVNYENAYWPAVINRRRRATARLAAAVAVARRRSGPGRRLG